MHHAVRPLMNAAAACSSDTSAGIFASRLAAMMRRSLYEPGDVVEPLGLT